MRLLLLLLCKSTNSDYFFPYVVYKFVQPSVKLEDYKTKTTSMQTPPLIYREGARLLIG